MSFKIKAEWASIRYTQNLKAKPLLIDFGGIKEAYPINIEVLCKSTHNTKKSGFFELIQFEGFNTNYLPVSEFKEIGYQIKTGGLNSIYSKAIMLEANSILGSLQAGIPIPSKDFTLINLGLIHKISIERIINAFDCWCYEIFQHKHGNISQLNSFLKSVSPKVSLDVFFNNFKDFIKHFKNGDRESWNSLFESIDSLILLREKVEEFSFAMLIQNQATIGTWISEKTNLSFLKSLIDKCESKEILELGIQFSDFIENKNYLIFKYLHK